ncbi:unnamed protein product, partial [Prorocentrum cordatum]
MARHLLVAYRGPPAALRLRQGMKSVGKQSAPRYLQKCGEFSDFSTGEVVGEALVQRTNLLYLDGWQVGQAEEPLAAAKLDLPWLSKGGQGGLPRARAPRGSRKAALVACRFQLPHAWEAVIVGAMPGRGGLESVQGRLVMHEAYLRTGEATRLQAGGLAPPVSWRRSHARVLLILDSSGASIPTKTSVLGDVVTLVDWFSPTAQALLLLRGQRSPSEPLFVATPGVAGSSSTWPSSTWLVNWNLTSYQFRHSDRRRRARSVRRLVPDIAERGRRATFLS